MTIGELYKMCLMAPNGTTSFDIKIYDADSCEWVDLEKDNVDIDQENKKIFLNF